MFKSTQTYKVSSLKKIIAITLLAAITNAVSAQNTLTDSARIQNAKTAANVPKVKQVIPPLFGYYSKLLICDGLAIRSSAVVDDKALQVAYIKMQTMLSHITAAQYNLAQWGSELHIIGHNQNTSDLPEFKAMKGVSYVDNLGTTTNIDDRTRGMGGIYASCGEENLLNLPGDRYPNGQDICIHEFAHNIMDYGMDDTIRNAIQAQYKNAMAKGLWKDTYASTNANEYWAELSMWYFGQHGEYLKGTLNPHPGPKALQAYDADGYALLKAIYSGKMQSELVNVVAAKMELAGAKTEVTGVTPAKACLMIANNTLKKLKLFWIGYDGKLQAYGEIGASYASFSSTYTTHVWMVADEAGKPVAYFKVNGPYVKAVINP